MNDRELLELAAKAAGLSVQYSDNFGDFSIGEPYSPGEIRWNALTDDGDALRLAVKTQLEISIFRDHVTAYHRSGWCDELFRDDAYAATRRAIVRAAAAIGAAL